MTNATLINKNNVSFIVKNIDEINISIDGIDEKTMIRANGDIYTCPLIIDEELKENNILRVSDLSEVENGKLYNLKEKLLSQNPKCRTCKVNPFCWNCIATIKENTENGAMDDYCSKVKAFYFNTVWGE